jgi:hypothetical protein
MSIIEKQNRLRAIATDLKAGSLTSEDRDFLCGALFRIADGEDAKTALDVKARRGERSSKASHAVQKMSDSRLILALGWIKVAITPEPDGLGLTIEEAIARIGEGGVFGKAFSFTEETLKTYWTKYPELQNLEMFLPD